MGKLRRVNFKHFVQQKVLGSGREPFLKQRVSVLSLNDFTYLSANDVSDSHQVVVHYICKMIGGKSIVFKDNLVIYHFVFEPDFAVNYVFELCVTSIRDFHSDNVRLSVSLSFQNFFLGLMEAESIIFGFGVLCTSHLDSHVLKSLCSAETGIGVTVLKNYYQTKSTYL